jgi:hypothetical protein
MSYILYSDDEQLRSEVYPLMDLRTQVITIGGFANEKAFAQASLPSAMIQEMSEKGRLIREPNERPTRMQASNAAAIEEAIIAGIQIIQGVLMWLQRNPGFIDWIRNGLDFGRLRNYDLLVYRVKNKGIFLEFKLKG